jgi:hypothetical protein
VSRFSVTEEVTQTARKVMNSPRKSAQLPEPSGHRNEEKELEKESVEF